MSDENEKNSGSFSFIFPTEELLSRLSNRLFFLVYLDRKTVDRDVILVSV